jgi:CubicO group peptidase (beta-lactamase class C family)
MGLLGYLLELQLDSTYEQLINSHVSIKYNMPNTTTNRLEVEKILVKGLDKNGDHTLNWDFKVLVGAGGVLSSVSDLSNFAQAHFDVKNKELSLTRKPTFTVDSTMKLGLGWHVLTSHSSNPWVWHNGGTRGYSSSMAINIGKKNAVIILSNVSTYHKQRGDIDSLCLELMKTLEI